MERRGVLKSLVAGAAALAASAIPYGLLHLLAPRRAAAQRNYLRPPGALKDDAALVAACIGCGLCGEVCPPRCIRFHARDGGAKVNTPYVDPGLPEAVWFESRHHSDLIDLRIVVRFCFGRWNVANWTEQAAVVEPADPFEGAISTASKLRHGPHRWITSVLLRPLMVSASALS